MRRQNTNTHESGENGPRINFAWRGYEIIPSTAKASRTQSKRFSGGLKKMKVEMPENMAKYLKEHDGVNVAVNFNSASADYGYAHILHKSVVMSKLTRTCQRCEYDQLWKPDDAESKCQRHSYGAYRYDTVFAYSEEENPLSLEVCFDAWLEAQPEKYNEPCKKILFGRFGWR